MKRTIIIIMAVCLMFPSTTMAFREETGGWNIMQEGNQGEILFAPDEPSGNTSTPTVETPETTGKPFEGSKVVEGAKGNLVTVSDVKGDYSKGSVYGTKLSTKELQEVKAAVIKAVNSCIRGGMSDREKIVALVNYLCDTVSYADDWRKGNANNAYGALIYGKAQCSGHARALIALLHAVDIDAKHVHASGKAINPSHQWVLLQLDGQWYHIDPQGIDDYMVINTTAMTISYPRPIVLMASYMPYETRGLPQTGNRDVMLQ